MKIINKSLLPLFLLMLLLFSPQPAYAYAISLKMNPSLLQIKAMQPADIWAPFTIENQGDQPTSLKIGYKPIDPTESNNGIVTFMSTSQSNTNQINTLLGKMQVVDDSNISHDTIDLGPKQKERLRLRIPILSQEQSNDYYFTLLFVQVLQNNNQKLSNYNIEVQKSSSTLQAGIGINVLLSVGPQETPQGYIDIFSTPWLHRSGPIPFTLVVHNNGMHFLSANGTIVIRDIFGKTVESITVPTSIILGETNRNFTSTFSDGFANSASGETPVLLSPDHFLFGVYRADLSLAISPKGPIYTRRINFFALPIVFVAEILMVIVLISYIYLRLKKKLSR